MKVQPSETSLSSTLCGDTCVINNLPPELLSRIFESGKTKINDDFNDIHLCECPHMDEDAEIEGVDGDSDANLVTSCLKFQILVSHVCQHWRTVALSTPSLWATICINSSDYPPYRHVSLMLERSKNFPIDIRVSCYGLDRTYSSRAELDFLYSLLVPHIGRWRSICVISLKRRHMQSFLKAVSHPSICSAPQLKVLALYQLGRPTVSKHLVPSSFKAPCLTHIILHRVHIDWDQPWIASASNLVHLKLTYQGDVRPSQFSSILHGAPVLERLALFQLAPSESPSQLNIDRNCRMHPDINGPIQLLKVTDLTLGFHEQQHGIALLRKFYLPSLKKLAIKVTAEDCTEFINVLAGPPTSLSQSSEQESPFSLLRRLECLRINDLPWDRSWEDKFYGELDNLSELQFLLVMNCYPQLQDILCVPSNSREGVRLPRLKTLYVLGMIRNEDVLREVAQWRMEAGAPLDMLYAEVDHMDPIRPEDLKWLKKNLKVFGLLGRSKEDDYTDHPNTGSDDED